VEKRFALTIKRTRTLFCGQKKNVIRIKVSIPEIRAEQWKVIEVLIPPHSTTLTGKNLTRAQSKCLWILRHWVIKIFKIFNCL